MTDHCIDHDLAELPAPSPALLDGACLFLDLDGTLIDIAARPDEVVIPADLPQLLRRLDAWLEGRLVLLTGRSLDQLDALLGCAELKAGASHGLERRPGGAVAGAPAWPDWADEELAELAAARPGVLVERKSFGIALHYRSRPDAASACEALALRLASALDSVVQPGKMVFEVKPREADKGRALLAFMDEPAFRSHRPVMIGDDLTDEPAFVAAQALGGAGVLVGGPRDTAADFGLPDPAAVLSWLEEGMRAA